MKSRPAPIAWLPRLAKVQLREELVNRALEQYAALAGVKAIAVRRFSRRFSGCQLDGLIFFVVQTPTKPTTAMLMAVDPATQRTWIPNVRGDHLLELAARIERRDAQHLVAFYEFVNLEYGLVEKDNAARLLRSDEDFLREGIDFDVRRFCSGIANSSLWWQRWGGKLYKVLWKAGQQGRVEFECEVVKQRIGKFKPCPYW